jgi:hypothetical protein
MAQSGDSRNHEVSVGKGVKEACLINATDILIDGGRSQLYHE